MIFWPQMLKKKDTDLQQVMAEERSRGTRHPLKALNLEKKRRVQKIVRMLSDKNFLERDYFSVLRDEFGLKDESKEFQELARLWYEHHGKS